MSNHSDQDKNEHEHEKSSPPSVAEFVSRLRHEFDEFKNETTSNSALLKSHIERIEKRLG